MKRKYSTWHALNNRTIDELVMASIAAVLAGMIVEQFVAINTTIEDPFLSIIGIAVAALTVVTFCDFFETSQERWQ